MLRIEIDERGRAGRWQPLRAPGTSAGPIECNDAAQALEMFAKTVRETGMETGQRFRLKVLEADPECRTCGETYRDGGDGYDGECPSCADRRYADECEGE